MIEQPSRLLDQPEAEAAAEFLHVGTKVAVERQAISVDCAHWHLRPEQNDKLPTRPLRIFSDFPENGQG